MSHIQVDLLERELWNKFSSVVNEMIVTKSGRRMFPVVKVRVTGLNPKLFYEMKLEFVQVGTNRWKYMNGGWTHGGKAESAPSQNIYKHPDSPNKGNFWMKNEGIHFSKVKLTNKPNPAAEQVVLNSLHKYQPVVLITEVDSISDEDGRTHAFPFPDASFIAVTAYQNDDVTNLKIRHNPFAKAFQDTRERPYNAEISCYSNSNLNGLSQLNSNLSSHLSNGIVNGNLLGSSGSNGSLVISSTTSINNQNNQNNPNNQNSTSLNTNVLGNYLDRNLVNAVTIGKCSPSSNSLTNSTGHSPNNSPSSSNLLNSSTLTSTYGLCNAATNAAYTHAVYMHSRSTPNTFHTVNNYYNNQNHTVNYQDLNSSNSSYYNLQSPDTMLSSNNSPPITNYNNLILNTTQTNLSINNALSTVATSTASTNQINNQSNCQLTTIEPLTTLTNSADNNNNSNNNSINESTTTNFLNLNNIKTSNSPIADLSSPSTTNLSNSSSSSSSSSLSSSSYCERVTPLTRNHHRILPYPKSAVGSSVNYTPYHNIYGAWNHQQSSDLSWNLAPESHYYSPVN